MVRLAMAAGTPASTVNTKAAANARSVDPILGAATRQGSRFPT